jgi:hypothetical protein
MCIRNKIWCVISSNIICCSIVTLSTCSIFLIKYVNTCTHTASCCTHCVHCLATGLVTFTFCHHFRRLGCFIFAAVGFCLGTKYRLVVDLGLPPVLLWRAYSLIRKLFVKAKGKKSLFVGELYGHKKILCINLPFLLVIWRYLTEQNFSATLRKTYRSGVKKRRYLKRQQIFQHLCQYWTHCLPITCNPTSDTESK